LALLEWKTITAGFKNADLQFVVGSTGVKASHKIMSKLTLDYHSHDQNKFVLLLFIDCLIIKSLFALRAAYHILFYWLSMSSMRQMVLYVK